MARQEGVFTGIFALKQPCYVADTGVMQPPHKNENLLFKVFQDFLIRSQHLPEKRIPFYLLRVSRFHEFCPRRYTQNLLLLIESFGLWGKHAVISSGSHVCLSVFTVGVKKTSSYGK